MALTLLVFILRAPYPGKRKSLGDARRERDLTSWPRNTCQENCLRIPVTIDGPGSFLSATAHYGFLVLIMRLPKFMASPIKRKKKSNLWLAQHLIRLARPSLHRARRLPEESLLHVWS